jgi:hypothetical protein
LPNTVAALLWSPDARRWLCAPEAAARVANFGRVPITLQFLQHHVLPRMPRTTFWMLLAFCDGWREGNLFGPDYHYVDPPDLSAIGGWRGAPGSIPRLSTRRSWVACYGAQKGDPSALVLPEVHYMSGDFYRPLFHELRRDAVPWSQKSSVAIYCGGGHGLVENYHVPVEGRPHGRRYLEQLAEDRRLKLRVVLGGMVSRRQQQKHKYIIDLDGIVRTWNAFAWKMASGSTVLSADSPWDSFFTPLFQPWVHFVPLANDLSDVAEKLQWCRDNDEECRAIAERARIRAAEAYDLELVAERTAAALHARLKG